MRKHVPVLIAVAALVLLVSCQAREDEPYRPPLESLEEASGETLYQRDCAWCHGPAGEGTRRAQPLTEEGTASVHFSLTTGRMPLPHPDATMRRGEPEYEPEQIEAIVEYAAGLTAGPEIPEVDPEQGVHAEGLQLYLENCAACHSSTGTGAILTSGIEVPDLFDPTATEIAEAMLVGPGTMPVFDSFTEEEVASIVLYVQSLQETSDRGGHPLGRLGPVSEGAIAWIVGLGLMLLVIRWIGTRAGS